MMNKSQILKKIGNIIEELSEQQQYLASTNKINLLELELFTANADFLIDHIEILKKLCDNRFDNEAQSLPIVVQVPEIPQKTEPPVIEDTPHNSVEEEEPERKFSFSFDEQPTEMIFDFEKKIAVEEVFDRPLNSDERRLLEEKSNAPVAEPGEFIVLDDDDQDDEEENSEEDIEPFLIIKDEPVSGSTANDNASIVSERHNAIHKAEEEERKSEPIKEQARPEKAQQPVVLPVQEEVKTFNPQPAIAVNTNQPAIVKGERPLTLNEMLSAKINQSGVAGQQRQSKKLEDLKAAISINDKMVFIKELFNGYNLAYSEAIEIVNRFESFEAADNFLQKNYAVKNDWEGKQITVARFYEYLHKKFVM